MKHDKVVTPYKGAFISCLARGPAEVTYEVNRWVKAPQIFAEHGHHRLVLTSLHSAMRFMHGAPARDT